QPFWGHVAPRGYHGIIDVRLSGGVQPYVCATALAPATLDRNKHRRLQAHEFALLLRLELYHAPTFVGPDGGEDLTLHAKIGVAHVLGFNGLRHAERDAAEVVDGHNLNCRVGGAWMRNPPYVNGGLRIHAPPTLPLWKITSAALAAAD